MKDRFYMVSDGDSLYSEVNDLSFQYATEPNDGPYVFKVQDIDTNEIIWQKTFAELLVLHLNISVFSLLNEDNAYAFAFGLIAFRQWEQKQNKKNLEECEIVPQTNRE